MCYVRTVHKMERAAEVKDKDDDEQCPFYCMMQGMRLHLAFVHRSEMGKVFYEERRHGLRVIKLTGS